MTAELLQKIDELSSENAILRAEVEYLEDSLTAIVTGDLPSKFDLNQLLLANRARTYFKMLEEQG